MDTPTSAIFEHKLRDFPKLSNTTLVEGPKFMFGDEIWRLRLEPVSKENPGKTEIGLTCVEKKRKGRVRFDLYVRTSTKDLFRLPCIREFTLWGRHSLKVDRSIVIEATEKSQEIIFGCQMFKDIDYPLVFPRSLVDDFSEMLNDVETADVEFKINGRSLYAHKAILAARLPFFKTMFYGSFGESDPQPGRQVVQLPDDDHDAFLAMLNFLYTGTTPPRSTPAEYLLRIADKYSMTYLLELTTEWAVAETTICNDETVGQYFKYGWRYPRLGRHLASLIADNYDRVSESETFNLHLRGLMELEVDPTAIKILMDALARRKR